jgi:hypothetical protein
LLQVLEELVDDLGGESRMVTFEQLLFALEGVPDDSQSEGDGDEEEQADKDRGPSAAAMLQNASGDDDHCSSGGSGGHFSRRLAGPELDLSMTLSSPAHPQASAEERQAVTAVHAKQADVLPADKDHDSATTGWDVQWQLHDGLLDSMISHDSDLQSQASRASAGVPLASTTIMVPIHEAVRRSAAALWSATSLQPELKCVLLCLDVQGRPKMPPQPASGSPSCHVPAPLWKPLYHHLCAVWHDVICCWRAFRRAREGLPPSPGIAFAPDVQCDRRTSTTDAVMRGGPVSEGKVDFDELTLPLEGEQYSAASPKRSPKAHFVDVTNPSYGAKSEDRSARSPRTPVTARTHSTANVMSSGKSISAYTMRKAFLNAMDNGLMLGNVEAELAEKRPPNPILQV